MTNVNNASARNYKTDVIAVNAQMKLERGNFAAALKVLNVLLPENSPAYIKNAVKAALVKPTDKKPVNNEFNALKSATRVSKSGKVSPFYILQAIYKAAK